MDRFLPPVSVGEIVRSISEDYIDMIEQKIPIKEASRYFLWGPPGIGKTSGVYQIKKLVEQQTKLKVVVHEIRVSDYSYNDIAGMMIPDRENMISVWLRPQILMMDDATDVLNLVFFDEIGDADIYLQRVIKQVIEKGKVGVHKLPDNCVFILASNRVTDNCMVYRIADSLANRACHFNVQPDFESWKQWAITHGIHEYVLGFLSFNNNKLYDLEKERDKVAFATPRSWEYFSNYLHLKKGKSLEELYPTLCGFVGMDNVLALKAWCGSHKMFTLVPNIFQGTETRYPKKPDEVRELIYAMIAHVSKEKDTLTDKSLEFACQYVGHFSADFAAMFYQSLMEIEGMNLRLFECPSFKRWLSKNKQIFKVKGYTV